MAQSKRKLDKEYIERNKLSRDALKADKNPSSFQCGFGHKLKWIRVSMFAPSHSDYINCCSIAGCPNYYIFQKHIVGCSKCNYYICASCYDALPVRQ